MTEPRAGSGHRRRWHRRRRVIPLASARSREGGDGDGARRGLRSSAAASSDASVLYRLAERGWTDTLLLERRELTSGSTWHAAGNVTYFATTPAFTALYVDSIRTYLEAERERGAPSGSIPPEASGWRPRAKSSTPTGGSRGIPQRQGSSIPFWPPPACSGRPIPPPTATSTPRERPTRWPGPRGPGERGSSGAARRSACAGWPARGRSRPPRAPSGRSTWFSRAASGRGSWPGSLIWTFRFTRSNTMK